ncbi:hypothetical protein EIP86_004615 [Pleurotus ostreatoroseus]|nr:hypothetical protein EIP86_004615 [Pleurotus ostreatoroseus]
MGFFKRFFSIGSRKSKRKNDARATHVDPSGRLVQVRESWHEEGDSTRLLRSSSTHFSIVNEVDYSALPPLPHPINNVAHSPAVTPTKSTSSLQRRGTYTVKVLERRLESRTEFPHANPPLHEGLPKSKSTPPEVVNRREPVSPSPSSRFDPRTVPITPRDQSRILRLRQDPSVASLLNMYDDNGRIRSTAFSNSPVSNAPEHGRQPIKRSGSTLRQLLGEPTHDEADEAGEGDISWAERFLGEHANSSQCSLASSALIETPKDTLYNHTLSENTKPEMPVTNITFSESSHESSANYPAISSMEVEVSATAPDLMIEVESAPVVQTTTPKAAEPKTPMRASEVFGFLTERRKTVLERQKSMRALETTPTPLGVVDMNPRPASTTPLPPIPALNISPDTSDTSITTTSAQIHTATFTKLTPILNPLSASSDSVNILKSAPIKVVSQIPAPRTRVQHTGDSQSSAATASANGSKLPRGPRPLPLTPSASRLPSNNPSKTSLASDTHLEPAKKLVKEASRYPTTPHAPHTPSTRIPVPASSADPFTPVRTRQQRRIVSHTSSVASHDGDGRRGASSSHPRKRSRRAERAHAQDQVDKENTPPNQPARAIFDKRHPNMIKGDPPSPASSSELSPVGREMMTTLRKQRMKTREHTMRSSLKRSARRSP